MYITTSIKCYNPEYDNKANMPLIIPENYDNVLAGKNEKSGILLYCLLFKARFGN